MRAAQLFVTFLIFVFAGTACVMPPSGKNGKNGYYQNSDGSWVLIPGTYPPGYDTGTGSSGADSDDDDSGDSDNNGSANLAPVEEHDIHGVGYNTTLTVYVWVNKVLKVRFAPGVQDSTVQGTGFSPNYSALGVYIKVGSTEQPTPLLQNGYHYGEPQMSQIMNFSNAYTKTCSDSNPSCRQKVAVKVIKPNYNYWCLNYPNGFLHSNGYWYYPCSGSGYSVVHDSHPWNGTLYIQTDDTAALQ